MKYEEKYKEALRQARVLFETTEDVSQQNWLCNVFPELRESEDERIRESLIAMLSQDKDLHGKEIAWLEKQEKNDIEKYINDERNKKDFYCEGKEMSWNEMPLDIRKHDYPFYFKGDLDCYPFNVEKQYKQNTANFEEAEKEKNDFVSGQFIECRKSFNEFQEFESYWLEYVGDDTYIGRSDNILNQRFHITPQQLFTLFTHQHYPKDDEEQGEQKSTDNVEPNFHIENGRWYVCIQSFTLNGNIVVAKGRTYKSQEDNVISGEDARLFIDKHDGEASKYFKLWTIQDAKDGDVLQLGNVIAIFKKTIEGSYNYCYCHCSICNNRFDIPEDTEEYGCYNAVPATKEQCDLLFQRMHEDGYEWNAEKKELKEIEQKSAWSEEDERVLQCLIRDQEQALEDVRNDKYGHSEIISDLKEMYRERIDWLKSIKPNHWKPSKEQMGTLNEWLKNHQYDGDSRYCYSIFQSLYNDLKTLI